MGKGVENLKPHDHLSNFTREVISNFDSQSIKASYQALENKISSPTLLWIAADTALVRAEISKDPIQEYFRDKVFKLHAILAEN